MPILQKLQEKLGDSVRENVPLVPYSTFKLGGPARYFFIAKTSQDIVKAAQAAKAAGGAIFLLAGGSNLLIADSGIDALVVKAENKQINVETRHASSLPDIHVKAEGGTVWMDFVNFTRERGLSGVEWGAGIPGTVGGAVRGNAGAFGQSVHQIIDSVEALDTETARVKNLSNKECDFSYRESIFKKQKNLIILSASFSLVKGEKEAIARQMQKHLDYRAKTQPCLPSAGCTFKNIIVDEETKQKLRETIDTDELEQKIRGGPSHKGGASKIGSAFLIDKAGLKGYRIGGVKVSEEHANFIVKIDDAARADHVVQLISYIKQQVRDQFGIQLQEEVQYAGF